MKGGSDCFVEECTKIIKYPCDLEFCFVVIMNLYSI